MRKGHEQAVWDMDDSIGAIRQEVRRLQSIEKYLKGETDTYIGETHEGPLV